MSTFINRLADDTQRMKAVAHSFERAYIEQEPGDQNARNMAECAWYNLSDLINKVADDVDQATDLCARGEDLGEDDD